MTDWKNPATIAQAFYAATALMWLCIGIYAYDTLQYLTFDLAIIFGKRQRRWPQLPYIFSKICMWTYLLTNMICFLTNTEINCNGTVKAIEMQMGGLPCLRRCCWLSVLFACTPVRRGLSFPSCSPS